MKQAKLDLAVRDFSAAIELDSGIAAAYAYRGVTLILSGRETEALPDLKRFIELKPEMKRELEEKVDLAKTLKRGVSPLR
jgi:tetratricopeptide (TPR) repeat protein